jgi:PAT family beta-lactamase induction signal transducer AmpG
MPEASLAAGAMSRAAALHRLVVVLVLGFASGLPLALTGQAMQAWLSMEGLDVATIGFLSLVGLPYPFKFLWAPLLDRFDLPWLGRRRGWLVLTQLALADTLLLPAGTSPASATRAFALLAVAVAFMSASQDMVIDAYRTDLLPALERGALGAQLRQFMQHCDLLVTPAVAVPAFDARPAGTRQLTAENMLGWAPFSYPFNLSQQPACSIPCGRTKAGLPIGLQIVGPMFGDALGLRAARAYETARPIVRPRVEV